MEYPLKIMMYCPKCNSHTEHKLKDWKKGKRDFMRKNSRFMYGKRFKGYGANKPKATGSKKQSKRFIALATCTTCKRKVYFRSATRMKKAQLAQK